MNRVIIAGSRTINDYNLIKSAIIESGFKIDEIISGLANGPDKLGKRYGIENNIPVKEFPAKWDEFGKSAGYRRNEEMAKYVGKDGFLILVWDGKSKGSGHMRGLAKKYGLTIFEKIVG